MKPHLEAELCEQDTCDYLMDKNGYNMKIVCIPYKSKKSAKRYSLKQLYNLWIEWVEKYNISCQKFYEEYGLPGSFITWLEEREKNG